MRSLLLDPGGVGREVDRWQSLRCAWSPMHRQIVQHDDGAGAQRRCEHVFDVGEEAHAIDRTVEDGRGREAGHA